MAITKAYVKGNIFRLDITGSTRLLQDSKANVNVQESENLGVWLISGPKLGNHEIPFVDLKDEAGVAYDATTWEDFYTSNTGFNPAAGGSVADPTGWASYVDTFYTELSPFVVASGVETILQNNAGTVVDSEIPLDVDTFYYQLKISAFNFSGTFVRGETIQFGESGPMGVYISNGDDYMLVRGMTSISFPPSIVVTGQSSGATCQYSSVINQLRVTGRSGDNLDLMLYFKAKPSSVSQWIEIWIDIGGGTPPLYKQTFSFPKGVGVERGILYALPSAYTLGTWEANGGVFKILSDSSVDIYDITLNADRSHKAK